MGAISEFGKNGEGHLLVSGQFATEHLVTAEPSGFRLPL